MSKAPEKRTREQQRRYDFFLNLTAWGNIHIGPTLGIICIEDGGNEWLRKKSESGETIERSFLEVDQDIDNTLNNPQCKLGDYYFPYDNSEKTISGTEIKQNYTAWLFQKACNPSLTADHYEYAKKHFTRGFEVVGNLLPFAKRKASMDLSPRMKDFIGYPQSWSLKEIYDDVLPSRLAGIANLASILGKNENGLLLFMGLIDKYEKEHIIPKLFGHYREPDIKETCREFDKKIYRYERNFHCWKRTTNTPTICFVDNATYKFNGNVCAKLLTLLKERLDWPPQYNLSSTRMAKA